MAILTPETWCEPSAVETGPEVNDGVRPRPYSNVCITGWRPLLITGLIRDMLTRHFMVPTGIEETDLRRYLWRADERTGILIESIFRWRGELVEKRPAVIIKRNAYQNVSLGIGDRMGITEQGHEDFCTFWAGSHTLFCIHGSGAGAEILATEVQRELTQFAPVIVEYLGLMRMRPTEVGAISEVEEARESFVVPVTIGWIYQETWRLQLESMKLHRLPLSVLLSGVLSNATWQW